MKKVILEFSVDKNKLLKSIQKNQGVISSKTILPVLANVLIRGHGETLETISTDLEISIISKVSAKIKTEGSVCIPLRRLLSVVRELPEDEINVQVSENFISTIKCGKTLFKIMGISAEEFPQFPVVEEAETIKLNSEKISRMINLVSCAVSQEESNYVLTGILFDLYEKDIKMVATDGRRLAVAKESLDSKTSFKENVLMVVPSKTIREVEKTLPEAEDVMVSFSENQIMFDLQDTQIISRLLEGKFPAYSQVIPKKSTSKLKVDKGVFFNALKRANILTTLDYQAVEFDIKEETVVLKKSTPEIGEMTEDVPAKYNGKPLVIGFNPAYLIDALRNLEENTLEIEFSDADKPAVIRLDHFLYIVLPIRII